MLGRSGMRAIFVIRRQIDAYVSLAKAMAMDAWRDTDLTPVKVKLDFEKGDRVRIREGAFANSEGEVKLIHETKDPSETPKVTVVVTIWGRPVDVDLDGWQVEKV